MYPWGLCRISCLIGVAVAGLGAPGTAYTQSSNDRVTELERKLDRSLKIIDELAARLKQIEAAAPKNDDVVKQSAQQSARIESVEQQVSQMAVAGAARRDDNSGLPLHGFADVGAGTASGGTRKGFTVGSLDFYLTPQLSERTKALIEVVFEVGADGGVAADLERMQLGYTFNDAATAWLGRFHTPYGYYNNAFHHGQQIATSLRRPRFIDFEDKGGILPAHTTGVWLTGNTRVGTGKVTYDVFGGNSPRIVGNTLNMNQAGSTNHNLDVGGNLGYLFGGELDGLKLGGHYLRARVADDQANVTKVNIWGGYAVYDTDRWEHIAEVYRFNNSDASGGTGPKKSSAGFVQLGYRAAHNWTPYARYERAALNQGDNYFAQQAFGSSYTRQALGLRYDLDLKSTLKVELAQTRVSDRSPTVFSEALLQYAIRF